MTAREVVVEHLPEVDGFLQEIANARDDDDRHRELQRVSKLIRFLRAFYTAFLHESLDVRVKGFSYKDKRRVSRSLIRAEDRAARTPNDDELRARLELAALFEDLSNLLHAELEFGYSDEDEDYELFHRDAFPGWLEAVEEWLRHSHGEGDATLADEVHDRWSNYWDVIASTY